MNSDKIESLSIFDFRFHKKLQKTLVYPSAYHIVLVESKFAVTKLNYFNLSYYIDDAKRRTEGGSKMKDLLKNLDDVKKRVKIIEESEISVMAGCVNE